MNTLLQTLQSFFEKNDPVIVVNTSTNRALLCLRPQLQLSEKDEMVFVQFESLNDRGGNSVQIKKIHGKEPMTLYVENEEQNVLMFQALSLVNYRHYLQPHYANAPGFDDLEKMKAYVLNQ